MLCRTNFDSLLVRWLGTYIQVTNPNFTYGYVAKLIVYIYKQLSTYTFQCPIRYITIHDYNLLN